VKPVPSLPSVKGKLQSFTHSSLDILTHTGVIRVNIKQPLTTYKQVPSELSRVNSTSFVGVASVRQADGREVATQIKIFPPELRGAGEGSSMMGPAHGAMTHSRMTNGSVSRPAVSHSRMTNGTVQRGSGTTLVIHYQDGAQTVSVRLLVLVDGRTVYSPIFAGVFWDTQDVPSSRWNANNLGVGVRAEVAVGAAGLDVAEKPGGKRATDRVRDGVRGAWRGERGGIIDVDGAAAPDARACSICCLRTPAITFAPDSMATKSAI
jgi:hypothetical protein